ncbi:MAG: TonB family protein [Bacteroidota bacterium]
MANDQHTWLTHLLRWLSGEATCKDEQRLDALAKDDPFLAEALDGYRSLPEANHAASVTRLKAKIRQSQEKRRRGADFYIIRAAAAIVIFSISWQVFRHFERKDMGVAESQTMMKTEAESAPSTAPEVPELRAKSLDSAFAAAEEKAKTQDFVVEKKSPRTLPPPPKNEREKLADEQAPAANEFQVPTAQAAERVAAFATDSIEEIAQAAEDADVGEAKESEPTLQKSAPQKSKALEKDQPKPAAKKAWVAEPEGGFANLEKHIKNNLRYPTAAAQNNIEGEVTLSFRFKTDGIPTDFRVEKSLGFGCDEEAERLLRTGPRWKFTSGARVSYTISFKK